MPELLQNSACVLLVGYLLAGSGLLTWVHLSRQEYVPRTFAYAARLLVRLGILFLTLWLMCEWLHISAAVVATVSVLALILLATGSMFESGAALGVLWVLQQYVLGFPDRREFFLEPPADEAPAGLPAKVIGQTSVAVSALRPTGKVEIGERTYNAVSESGDFIEGGATVVVREVNGNQVSVRGTS